MEIQYLEMIENLCLLNGKLEAIIESNTNGIFEIDGKGKLLSCNPSFREIFQIDEDKKMGNTIFEYLESKEIHLAIEDLLNDREQILFREFLLQFAVDKKIKERFLELKVIPIPTPNQTQFIGIVKDKSDVLLALTNREDYISKLLNIIDDIKVDNRNTIYHLASIVELRDNVTGKHLQRVESYTRVLATAFMNKYAKRDTWVSEHYVEDMALSSVLHDIGKVGISDSILLKPSHLSDMEMEAMRQHTTIAGRALEKYRGKKDFLAMGREIALTHHEKWNGQGYPRQLEGKDIPLSGRIVSLCDTYDAVTSTRPYKKAMTHNEAVRIITEEREKSFDPELVDLFLQVHPKFEQIKTRLSDSCDPEE